MKRIHVFLSVLAMSLALLVAVHADDVSSGAGAPIRTTGGRLNNKGIVSLGTRSGENAAVTVLRTAGGTLTEGDVVKLALTPIPVAGVTPGTNYSNAVILTSAALDIPTGVVCIRDGSRTSATAGGNVDVAVEGDVVVNCAVTTPGVITVGDWVGASTTPGQVLKVVPCTTPCVTQFGSFLGRALESNAADSGKIRVQIQRR